jgi:hypothetical protein
MAGYLDVLSCHRGHLHINFDKADPLEAERAKRVIKDMMRRGYSLFVETEGGLRKVTKFDPETESYVIADGPEKPAETTKKRGAYRTRKVRMQDAKVTGVGPTSGG